MPLLGQRDDWMGLEQRWNIKLGFGGPPTYSIASSSTKVACREIPDPGKVDGAKAHSLNFEIEVKLLALAFERGA